MSTRHRVSRWLFVLKSSLRNASPMLHCALIGWLCSGLGGRPVNGQTPKLELLQAVSRALSRHPQITAQQAQIEISQGAKAIESSIFDPLLQSGLTQTFTVIPPLIPGLNAIGPGTDTINQTSYSLNGTKLYRSGVSVTPYYQLNRNVDSYLYPNGYSSASAGITVNAPLLRKRGAKIVAAPERAAEMEVQATQHDFEFLLARIANAVAQDYWSLVAAYRNLDVALSAESRGQAYVENTQALINADHVPRSDINEVLANLAGRTEVRIAAQNALVIARQRLSQDIGQSAEEIAEPLGDPADDFPAVPATPDLSDSTSFLKQRLNQAFTRRADYQAALIRKEKSLILLPVAQNALRPALNVTVSGGYQGLRGGRGVGDVFASTFSGVRGPTVSAGLTYSYPLGNHAAFGALQQAQASIRQAEVSIQEVARDISETTTVAVDSVRSAILRVERAQMTVNFAQQALTGARDKYRAGFGSVVEILQFEDRLNSALSDQVQARLSYALALVQYRFSVGTLVPANQQVPVIRKEAFVDPISVAEP
jgi:outer membrane protein TolC